MATTTTTTRTLHLFELIELLSQLKREFLSKNLKSKMEKENETFSFLLLLFTALWAAGDTEDPQDFLG